MPPPNKKRKITVVAPEKIEFDPSAREEYLTGFHKRKVARQKFAQEEIAKKEKEEKLRFRRELRQQRKVDLEKHVEEVNRLVKQANGEIPGLGGDDDEESSGDEDDFKGFEEPEPINQEDEYIDEDKYTTVTIESVGISRDGFSRPGDASDDEDNIKKAAAAAAKAEEGAVEELGKKAMGKPEIKRDANGKRIWTKEKPKIEWVKKKKKKFRYETKAERKVERAKLGAKKKKQREARSKKDEK